MNRTAHCSCGLLRVETRGEPNAVVVCHCHACQRRTGSVFGIGAYFPQDKVRISGDRNSYTRLGESGGNVTTHFCPQCGTNVFWEADKIAGSYGVAVGAFAEPGFPAPVRSVWEESKHAWVGLPAGVPHFARGRDSR
jgi:hypothetical protein